MVKSFSRHCWCWRVHAACSARPGIGARVVVFQAVRRAFGGGRPAPGMAKKAVKQLILIIFRVGGESGVAACYSSTYCALPF